MNEFNVGAWNREINVRDFIQRNYTPYDGDDTFLTAPSSKTIALWDKLCVQMKIERQRSGVYDIDEKTISTITSHAPGYIDRDLETIVGLQTDEPLKRAIMPFGGIRLIHTELEAYGRKMDPIVEHVFKYRKTHNDGVFDVYTDEMKMARHAGIMTGLPDAYGRGRIIGDYRRVALYGVDKLIEDKKRAKKEMIIDVMDSHHIRRREEIAEQIKSLHELKEMAASYGFDISNPAQDTKEARRNDISLRSAMTAMIGGQPAIGIARGDYANGYIAGVCFDESYFDSAMKHSVHGDYFDEMDIVSNFLFSADGDYGYGNIASRSPSAATELENYLNNYDAKIDKYYKDACKKFK